MRTYFNLQKILIVLSLIAVPGCTLGRYASKTIGGDTTDPLYSPSKRTMVVIVKDEPDPSGLQLESEQIAADIDREIKAHEVAPLVPSDRVIEYRSDHPAESATMSAAQIGKAVGAEQVLLVRIDSSVLDTQSTDDMMKGRISAFVSILDTHSGATLWPTDGSGGANIDYATPLYRLGDKNTPQGVQSLMCIGLAKKITQQFYSYDHEDE